MKVLERNVLRLAVVQHIRSLYGIKIKNWNKSRNKATSANTTRVFGVPLDALPHCHVLDYGEIPCFMVDVCSCLLQHVDVEGLFRRSGSVLRLKSLRARLDQGEECLSTALPLDLAGLLKQFFRELPEPALSVDLHAALLKAQELPAEEDRTSATLLLSCVLPDQNLSTLRYFFSFLKSVSQRSAENKMDSSNLSVIFAPNLFHCAEGAEKLSSGTEKKLKLQAAAVQRLIDHAQNIGVVPQFLMEKVPVMLGCDPGLISPSSESAEENNNQSGQKKSSRRSLGDVVSGALSKMRSGRTPGSPAPCERVFSMATPVIMTPNSKRKLPVDLPHSHGFSSKKRRSIKKNLGLELFPSTLFGGSSTPGSAHSAAAALDSSMSSCSSARRKSRRLRDRVSRVESGKAGCFSPRASKKEAVRKSLRLRFSLSKSSRECNTITHSQLGPKGSEVIGWRLATQESGSGFHFSKEPAFSPAVLERSPAPGSWKFLDKAEDERSDPFRETSSRALATSTLPIILFTGAEALSDQHSPPEATVPSVRRSHGLVQQQMEREPELVPRPASEPKPAESPASSPPVTSPTPGAEETFHQFQTVPMTPLHIDSTVFEELMQSSRSSFCEEGSSGDCSRLIDALDIQSPVAFRPDASSRVQSTPCAPRTQTRTSSEEPPVPEDPGEQNVTETGRMKVADQVRLFNTMTLNSPKARRLRSPLKFQRTPVRQSVRRLDSLLGCVPQGSPVVKALSLESGLFLKARAQSSSQQPVFLKPKPPVPPKKPQVLLAFRNSPLDDVTNRAAQTEPLSANRSRPSVDHYRGSPRNPLTDGRLLSATKPIDL